MIAIVDYGMGNLRSVEKGFLKVGVEAKVVSDPRSVDDASGVVLPGVGAFRDCMRNLTDMDFIRPIVRAIEKGKPYLGICLGLQVLFSESEEFGSSKGLGIFKGKVLRFPGDIVPSSKRLTVPSLNRLPVDSSNRLKVPHMGWNTVKITKQTPLLAGIPDGSYFYFVHSFYVAPDNGDIIAATTDYGVEFVSMIARDNIFATQFHPEKSQAVGLKMLKAFGDFVRGS